MQKSGENFLWRGGGARQPLMTNLPGPLLNLRTRLRRCTMVVKWLYCFLSVCLYKPSIKTQQLRVAADLHNKPLNSFSLCLLTYEFSNNCEYTSFNLLSISAILSDFCTCRRHNSVRPRGLGPQYFMKVCPSVIRI